MVRLCAVSMSFVRLCELSMGSVKLDGHWLGCDQHEVLRVSVWLGAWQRSRQLALAGPSSPPVRPGGSH